MSCLRAGQAGAAARGDLTGLGAIDRKRNKAYALSRRRRAIWVGAALIGMVLIVWLDRSLLWPRWSQAPALGAHAVAPDFTRYDSARFAVVRVVDGDTLQLAAPDGTDRTTTVRLLGIDAPEMGYGRRAAMYYASEAAARARQLALGKDVTVYLDERAEERDNYGRLLAYVELPDGTFLNEQLLLDGCAYADLRFRHSYYQKYKQLEASARALGKGLWTNVSEGQQPSSQQDVRAVPPSQN